ncbi:MAG: hypothetical protein M0R73_07465 [Dehalococcoidia bacterium]|nr:hypothetical protein [Dehalococcoidia bacterium]
MDTIPGDTMDATGASGEASEAELAAWTRSALLTVAPTSEVGRLHEAVRATVEEAYESALVQGLCRDGARELLQTTAVEEARRLLDQPARDAG